MKKNLKKFLKVSLLTFGIVTAFVLSADAQFSTGITVTGTTNAMLPISGSVPSNSVTFYVPLKPLTLSGIVTNETANLSYGVAVFGSTNPIFVNTLTLTFPASAGYTNGSTFTTNIPAQSVLCYSLPWVQAQFTNAAGNVTNTINSP